MRPRRIARRRRGGSRRQLTFRDVTAATGKRFHEIQNAEISETDFHPAIVQANRLMPHWGRATAISSSHDEAPETEDDDASWGGLPFLQPPDGMAEDEWIDFVRHYESEYISDLPVADVIS